jgi:serine/threonine-protein kinase
MMPDRIGPYEVKGEIGRGGMGVVYRARDTKLDRDVAVKALPETLSDDPDRLARFQREARLLASLNHSNVAGVYGLEEVDGERYLILEYVDGEDLDARLQRGPLPLEDALAVGKQIAKALEAAHASGVIHRDLKPGNVKLLADGRVKVLDFGLAKAADESAASGGALHDSPTLAGPATPQHSPTVPGVILGTAGYMSPEQARGKTVDKRSDIWSFGCVLYETITGAQPFGGETVTDCIAATIRADPDWEALPPQTPHRVKLLLRHCLAKDPHKRLHDIADARVEIDEIIDETASGEEGIAVARRTSRVPHVVAVVLALALVASLVPHLLPGKPSGGGGSARTTHVAIGVPFGQSIEAWGGTIADISPDGRRAVYSTNAAPHGTLRSTMIRGAQKLYVGLLDEPAPMAISAPEGVWSPFFSRDGRTLAYFGADYLWKVPVTGGVSTPLAPVTNGMGGAFAPDGSIIYAPHWSDGLWRVPPDGGDPEPFTTLDTNAGEASHRWPHVTPDGKAVIFTIKTRDLLSFDDARIAVAPLGTGRHRVLFEGGTGARLLPTGHLIFGRHSSIYAAPFDADILELAGSAVPVLHGVEVDTWDGGAQFSVANDGTLLYAAVGVEVQARDSLLLWVDRKGNTTEFTTERRGYAETQISPNGQQVVASVGDANGNLWMADVANGSFRRLTFGAGNNLDAIWTPDGQRVTFFSDRERVPAIYSMPADGSGQAEHLVDSRAGFPSPDSWSPDGSVLLYTDSGAGSGLDLRMLEGGRSETFLATRFDESVAKFSPDGEWIAYQSNESGASEVYVRPFRGSGSAVKVSQGGGENPVWAHSGDELFYRVPGDGAFMAVSIRTQPRLRAETPVKLFDDDRYEVVFDVAADGRFLVVQREERGPPVTHLNLVLNWFGELREKTN